MRMYVANVGILQHVLFLRIKYLYCSLVLYLGLAW